MSTSEQHSAQRKLVVTLLWIIALFVFISLTETVLGIGVIQTSDGVQIALTAFVIAFPLLVAGTFLVTLWVKNWVFFPPSEFGSGTNVEFFVQAMSGRAKSLDNLQHFPQKTEQAIQDNVVSPQVITKLSGVCSQQSDSQTKDKEIRRVLGDAVSKALDQIRKEGFLTIDSRPLLGADGPVWQVVYDRYDRVSALLDDICYSLKYPLKKHPTKQMSVAPYGELWLLRDAARGCSFTEMGKQWAAKQNRMLDDRDLAQVGIEPGMVLEVVPVGLQTKEQ